MVKSLYCAEVDGTILSPTTVAKQHNEKYQGFNIDAKNNNGTGTLVFVHMNKVDHIAYPMPLSNGLRYNEFDLIQLKTAKISQLDNAYLSNLWHRRLIHPRGNILKTIHKLKKN